MSLPGWSSYRSHAGDAAIHWLTEPIEYRRLGDNCDARALAHRELFKQPLTAYDLEEISAYLNKDCALGSGKFQEEIEAMAGRRAKIVPQGRPRNPKDAEQK